MRNDNQEARGKHSAFAARVGKNRTQPRLDAGQVNEAVERHRALVEKAGRDSGRECVVGTIADDSCSVLFSMDMDALDGTLLAFVRQRDGLFAACAGRVGIAWVDWWDMDRRIMELLG